MAAPLIPASNGSLRHASWHACMPFTVTHASGARKRTGYAYRYP